MATPPSKLQSDMHSHQLHPSHAVTITQTHSEQLVDHVGSNRPVSLGVSPQSTTSNSPHSGVPQERRPLPTRDVTEENFNDAYVSFIMYCNPAILSNTDTTELRRAFRTPPKSDGKAFNTFTLYELIRKLELRELKSWAQLALELGVEPPVLEKGQSAQKVQQWAVRLKRWMHAMHVDAFFEYLLNKPHGYWMQEPYDPARLPEHTRDGVPPEEDLAVRALRPETRPKRGRRKAGEKEDESEMGKSPVKRSRLHSPTISEDFKSSRMSTSEDHVTPATAHPAFHSSFDDRGMTPWSATDAKASSNNSFRWGSSRDAVQTPISAYPQSAITPSNRTAPWNDLNEPRSAITSDRSRSKRKHGPAVSSAWPSNGSTSSGKLRGRPPSNRSVQDGPFSTFPAGAQVKELKQNAVEEAPPAAPIVESPQVTQFYSSQMRNDPSASPLHSRPRGLSLQVPQRQGGTVQLSTPQPVLLVNGSTASNLQANTLHPNGQMMDYYNSSEDQNNVFHPYVNITFRQNEDSDRTNVDALESHFICEILAAEWYDASGLRIEKCTIDEASKICKQVIRNLQDESGSPEAFLMSVTALAGGPLRTHVRMTRLDENDTKTEYECHWRMRFGAIEGDFTIRATVQHSVMTAHGPHEEQSQVSWKKRYLDLQQRIRERDVKVESLKKNILDALVASNQMMMDKRGEHYPLSAVGR